VFYADRMVSLYYDRRYDQTIISVYGDLRLALLYKVVMGHVGIQPEHVGLVATDDRTRAKHQFKFCGYGFFNTSIPPLFCGSNRRTLEFASVPCGKTVNPSIFQGGAVQVDIGHIRTVKRHPRPCNIPRGKLWITYQIRSDTVRVAKWSCLKTGPADCVTVVQDREVAEVDYVNKMSIVK